MAYRVVPAVEVKDVAFQVQERKRPDRHPYQVGCLAGLLGFAVSQLVVGIPDESVLHGTVRYSLIAALDATFIVGSLLCLLGAALHRNRDPRLSLRLGIAGQFSVFAAALCYTIIAVTVTDAPYWLSIISGALGIGVTYAAVHRMAQQWQALHRLKVLVRVVHPES